MTRAVVVTGGAGYVGSHAAKALDQAGYLPVSVDNLARGHRWAVKWGPLETGDILERDFLDAVFERWQPEAVLHFAAFAYVGESVAEPARYWRNNVLGSLNLVEAMRDHGVGRLVFSSSCAVYGAPSAIPIREHAHLAPINPYGAGKVAVESMLRDFGAAHGLMSIALRYFNAAGADPGGSIGEAHDPETHVIPLALEAAAGKRPALTVFGDDYPTQDGTCVRDYVHVSDLAHAHVLALEALEARAPIPALNLGTGAGASVGEIVAAVERVSGRRVRVEVGARRAGDPPALVADARAARQELGWTPRLSDLDSIIGTAWAWAGRAPTA
ncbi:MAG: UDP-glucose 4-epimerase GalE [Pseudomonadota bacterium]